MKQDSIEPLNPEPYQPKKPAHYQKASRALIRIQNLETDEFLQEYGVIYTLNPKDESTLAVYGGHQVIVLDREIADFDKWTIVSLVELWG